MRYVDESWDLLFYRFKSSHPNIDIGKTTFRKMCPKEIKKARKLTDMCEYCELGKKTKAQLTKILTDFHSSCLHGSSLGEMENCLLFKNLKEDKEKIRRWQKIVDLFEKHYEAKNRQRSAFKAQVCHLKKGEVIFVLDFKENLKLNVEQVQLGRSFYNQPQRTMFEVVMIFKNDNDEIKYFYWDFFSRCLNHNAFFVKKALSKIFKHDQFLKHNFHSITFWMDNAKHFKNKELAYYFCKFFRKTFKRRVQISWNFFIEGHGKNLCDTRFSFISRLLNEYTNKKNKKLKTTKDIVSAIQSEISKINEIKTLKNKNFELSEQIILNFKFPSSKFVYNFEGISNFYHFHICYNSRAVRENKISIVSSVFTNDLETFSFPYRIVKKDRNEKMKDGFDDITNDFELKLDESTLSFLERKFRNIENFTSSRSQQQINSTTQNQGTILINTYKMHE